MKKNYDVSTISKDYQRKTSMNVKKYYIPEMRSDMVEGNLCTSVLGLGFVVVSVYYRWLNSLTWNRSIRGHVICLVCILFSCFETILSPKNYKELNPL